MSEKTEVLGQENGTENTKLVKHHGGDAHADEGGEAPTKRRRTRRGKSKRRAPYRKQPPKKAIVKPEAPHNDNQFLLEDHGGLEQLDERLKNNQTSSLSVSEEEFYSSPDDEEEFLMQDFNDQYQSMQDEQLQKMSKQELIEEYLALDNRTAEKHQDLEECITKLRQELDEQHSQNAALRKENEALKRQLNRSDTEDSETDSSDSCCSSSSSLSSSSSGAPEGAEYKHTNGHLSPPLAASIDAV